MIENVEDLRLCIDFCLESDVVAVDTEFVWEKTYFPILGLIQLAVGEKSFLIDTVAINDLSDIGRLMASETTVKVFHDALQDLQIIHRITGVLPKNIFDTKLAFGFSGETSSISLGHLLETCCGVVLPKTESRTNWLQRPLTDKQIEYAKDDVIYMKELHDILMTKLNDCNNYDRFKEEMENLEKSENYDISGASLKQFNKASGTSRLKPQNLALLRELMAFRESYAQRRDLPRNFIMSNDILVEIAKYFPQNAAEVAKIPKLPHYVPKRYTKQIVEATAKVLEMPEDDYPKPFKPIIDRKELKKHSDRIVNFIREKAVEEKIDPTCIASRKDANSLVNKIVADKDYSQTKFCLGWRKEFFAELEPLIVR